MGKPTRQKACFDAPPRSKYKGVASDKRAKLYECRISIKRSKRFLGYFSDQFSDDSEAARVYDEHAALFGKPVNFPIHQDHKQQAANDEANATEVENSAISETNSLTNGKEGRKRSKYVGVCWYKKNHRWEAKIWMNGKSNKLGYFLDEAEAARVYDEQATLLGKPVNFPKQNGQQKAVKKREGLCMLPNTARPSRWVGVNWHKREKKWQASINTDGKKKTLGLFFNEEEAARVYDKQAALRGKAVNFPQHNGQEQAVKPRSKNLSSNPPTTKASEKHDYDDQQQRLESCHTVGDAALIMDGRYDQPSSSSSSSSPVFTSSYCTMAQEFISCNISQSSIFDYDVLIGDDLCVVCKDEACLCVP